MSKLQTIKFLKQNRSNSLPSMFCPRKISAGNSSHQSSISYLNFWKSPFNKNEVFTHEVMAATNCKTNLVESRGLKKNGHDFRCRHKIDICMVPSTLDIERSTLNPRRKDRLSIRACRQTIQAHQPCFIELNYPFLFCTMMTVN